MCCVCLFQEAARVLNEALPYFILGLATRVLGLGHQH